MAGYNRENPGVLKVLSEWKKYISTLSVHTEILILNC